MAGGFRRGSGRLYSEERPLRSRRLHPPAAVSVLLEPRPSQLVRVEAATPHLGRPVLERVDEAGPEPVEVVSRPLLQEAANPVAVERGDRGEVLAAGTLVHWSCLALRASSDSGSGAEPAA